jgi:hypothetical protein
MQKKKIALMAAAMRCDTTARYVVAVMTSSTKNIASKLKRARVSQRRAREIGPPRVVMDCAFAHVNRLVSNLDIILEIRNVGPSAARKINFSLESTPAPPDATQLAELSAEQSLDRKRIREIVLLQKPVYMLAPGGRVAVLLGAFVPSDSQLDLLTENGHFAVRAQYQDEANKSFRAEIIIDLETWDGATNPNKKLNAEPIFKPNFEKLSDGSEYPHQYSFKDQNLIPAASATSSAVSKRVF